MTWYIAGPMTGHKDYNFPAFAEAAALLRGQGEVVISPHELHEHTTESWEFYMRAAIHALTQCTHMFVLRGYETSRGAQVEIQLATLLKMPITYQG